MSIATSLKNGIELFQNYLKKQMHATNYFLIQQQERDIIVHGATGLRVHVFGLEVDKYWPAPGELHIFGDDHGEWLAFETEGWAMESMDVITGAVIWYARYLDYPEMTVLTEDPRPEHKLRKI